MFDSREPVPVAPADPRLAVALAAVAAGEGARAVGVLATVDPFALGEVDRIRLLQAWERCSRWVAAQQATAVVAVAGPAPADRDDSTRELVRVALLDVGGSARVHVDVARALAGRHHAAQTALATGALSWPSARALVDETERLDDATAARVAEAVLPWAGRGTVAEFRRRVRRAVIQADPLTADQAAQLAAADRQVSKEWLPDAQAALHVVGPAPAVQTIWTALDVRAAGAAGDGTTLDQRRFDALAGLCADYLDRLRARRVIPSAEGESRQPGRAGRRAGQPATVHVYADAATWAGLADEPVELEGYGPIPAGLARDCFIDADWRAVVTDTVTALPLGVSDVAYRPSPRLRRLLLVKDRRCIFPGCGAAVWHCDADHSVPYADGGCTDPDNCGLACRRHHRLKTLYGWSWRRLPDGSVETRAPNGTRWQRDPIRYQMPPPAA